MLEALRAWLNGNRDYNLGVSLYIELGDNTELKTLLKNGKTAYCYARLQKELLAICVNLKTKLHATKQPAEERQRKKISINEKQIDQATAISTSVIENANPDLYAACKLTADKMYKEAMNARAVLFSMVPSELYEDPNRPDLVASRVEICLKVVKLFNESSSLYDKADYVRTNGKLEELPSKYADVDIIADHLVKNTLDNKRKNFNKIKTREQTPERVIIMQKYAADILKLQQRWLTLK